MGIDDALNSAARSANPVSVSGGWKGPDEASFSWSNVSAIPTDEQIRQIIVRTGADPDDFEWWPTNVHFGENDAAWLRDPNNRGEKASAYTGRSKRGHVTIVIRRKARAPEELRALPAVPARERRHNCAVCGRGFDHKRVGTLYCSAACRNGHKGQPVNTIRHVIIPDTQVRPGVPTDHLVWAGQWIREHCQDQPVRIVHLDDHWDMPSLSSYDKGKKSAEGRRVRDDLGAGNRAFTVLDEAIGESPLDADGLPLWTFDLTFGNHPERILRYVEDHPELDGFLSLDNCITPERWRRHEFLKPVELEGIYYAHYFYQPNTGRPFAGENIEARIRQVGHSFVMGHQQGLRLGATYDLNGHQRLGVVCGSFYQHDEDYKGPQGNNHWRGIVVLNGVEDGSADPMPLSMDYLCRSYAGHPISEHTGVTV